MLSRLAMLEVLDRGGPMTVTELARRSGLDVAVVSRTVSACEPDGWIARRGNRVAIGPRSTLLGYATPFAAAVAAAAPLVHALAGATGLTANAVSLVGRETVVIAAAAGLSPIGPPGLAVAAPVYATAGGRALAAHLEPDELDQVLPPEPYPDAAAITAAMAGTMGEVIFAGSAGVRSVTPGLPSTRGALDDLLAGVRTAGYAVDDGDLDPALHCLAVAWPGTTMPTALVCLGPAGALAERTDLVLHALRAAVAPGATVHSILAIAAGGAS